MSWNYRVVKEFMNDKDDKPILDHEGNHFATYSIREVYYDRNDRPMTMCAEPESLSGDSIEDLENLVNTIKRDFERSKDSVITFPDDFDGINEFAEARAEQTELYGDLEVFGIEDQASMDPIFPPEDGYTLDDEEVRERKLWDNTLQDGLDKEGPYSFDEEGD